MPFSLSAASVRVAPVQTGRVRMSNGQTNILLVAACAQIDAAGRVLLAQRPEGKSIAGLGEFPQQRCGVSVEFSSATTNRAI
jgi:hypothetical protein